MPPRIILCPGQGAQFVGMGKSWFEKSPEARATGIPVKAPEN